MRKPITISEALGWLKTMTSRHNELVQMRNASAATIETSYQGQTVKKEPKYDAKALDKIIAVLAREIRLCDNAIKATNGRTELTGYQADDDVLAELI